MNHWKDMFFIWQTARSIEATLDARGVHRTFTVATWFVVNNNTGEITHGKYRKYGYSGRRDACRGAAQIFNHYINSIEKDLLG